ncbi:ureide permease 3-like isoform X1 [Silene latifolia]|uniref:ureide permease 3-like isoform X1 n=1 Tax=Silene latifolia TaxID=37657 RepID=UPI003D786E44
MFDSPIDPISPPVEFDKAIVDKIWGLDMWSCVLMAMLGGLFLSLGNVLIQYAWAFVGLSVAQVITSSIAVVIGTSLNYFLDDKINKVSILFPGVACFLTAVLLGSTVHSLTELLMWLSFKASVKI